MKQRTYGNLGRRRRAEYAIFSRHPRLNRSIRQSLSQHQNQTRPDRWMTHHQPLRIGLQGVVDPGTEQRGFHGATPRFPKAFRPASKRAAQCRQFCLPNNSAICRLYAITDGFLVYVQSDIVDNIHGVLLIEISEPAARNSRSQHSNLEENPSSFPRHLQRHLYIQTDEITPETTAALNDVR